MTQCVGRQSLRFTNAPYLAGCASVVGEKEGEGPFGDRFDKVISDPYFGKDTWEEAESRFQEEAVTLLLKKTSMTEKQLRFIFAGDLLGQTIATSFGVVKFGIPLFGLYGACSTAGESLALSAMTVAAGYAEHVLALTSSHFGGAEKQFRFPLEYGNQRPLAATWTVTGSGAFLVAKSGGKVKISGITVGRVVDFGVKDSMNMGACMAPAACDTIYWNLRDFQLEPNAYDRIITGDLGKIGRDILIDLLLEKGIDAATRLEDCGMNIFDAGTQDTHAGGSGCGCSAVMLCAHVLQMLESGEWKKVLFVPTGALLSTVSYNEGQSVPGIAHALVLESVKEE